MQTKFTKNIQKILVILLVITITTIGMGIFFSVDVIAYCSHNLKEADFIKTEFYMTHITYYVCIETECDYKTQITEPCVLEDFKKLDDEQHEVRCEECLELYYLPHEDNNNNGTCDKCLCKTSTKHICLENSKEKIEIFDDVYHDYYSVCTLCENPVPDWQKREKHSFGEFTSKGSKGHSAICNVCGYELILDHEGANHENGGKCTVKGCGYRYQTHQKSTTLTGDYTDITDATHTPLYKCSHGGCNETYKGTAQKHKFINGKCECGEEVELEITSKTYELDDTYISNVQPESTVSKFKANIETNGKYVYIYNKENQVLSDSAKIGTGMKIKTKIGDQEKNFTIIVNGDVNGDRNVDFQDIVTINKVRLKITNLDEVEALAADVTDDGKVDFKDILEINKFRLKIATEL